MKHRDHVQAHTSDRTNFKLRDEARRRVLAAAEEPAQKLNARLKELDQEWDIERWLETNASTLALTGTVLGLTVSRKFLAIPVVVLSFLLLHALQGWCPPLPILRSYGVRTRREIDEERYALKALRGDFAAVDLAGDAESRAKGAWDAARHS